MIEELMVLSHCIMQHYLKDTPVRIKEVLKLWKAKLLRQKSQPKEEADVKPKKEKKEKKEKKKKEKVKKEVKDG